MIQEFVDKFIENKSILREQFKEKKPSGYHSIVESVVKLLSSGDYGEMDPEKIHCIDDGDYQGTLLFVIAAKGYQPSDYWYTMVSYGSCSGCDTLQAIEDDCTYDEKYNRIPTEQALNDYVTLALHIVQGLRKMYDK